MGVEAGYEVKNGSLSSISDMQIHAFNERLKTYPVAVIQDLLTSAGESGFEVRISPIGNPGSGSPNAYWARVPDLWNACEAVIGGGRSELQAAQNLAVKIAAGLGLNLRGSEQLAPYEKTPLRWAERPVQKAAPAPAELVPAA